MNNKIIIAVGFFLSTVFSTPLMAADSGDEHIRHEIANRDAIKYTAIRAGKNDAVQKNAAIFDALNMRQIAQNRNWRVNRSFDWKKQKTPVSRIRLPRGAMIALQGSFNQKTESISYSDYLAVMEVGIPIQKAVKQKHGNNFITIASK